MIDNRVRKMFTKLTEPLETCTKRKERECQAKSNSQKKKEKKETKVKCAVLARMYSSGPGNGVEAGNESHLLDP